LLRKRAVVLRVLQSFMKKSNWMEGIEVEGLISELTNLLRS
jgi:hypothetical protein